MRTPTEGDSNYERTSNTAVVAGLVKPECLIHLQNSCDPPRQFLGNDSNSAIYHRSSPMKCSYHDSISGNGRHKKIKGEVCKSGEFPLDLVGVGNRVTL